MSKKDFSFKRKESEKEKKQEKNIAEFIEGEKEDLVRKTIVIPEHYFTMVKIEAAKRKIKAYQLWGEIVEFYFKNQDK